MQGVSVFRWFGGSFRGEWLGRNDQGVGGIIAVLSGLSLCSQLPKARQNCFSYVRLIDRTRFTGGCNLSCQPSPSGRCLISQILLRIHHRELLVASCEKKARVCEKSGLEFLTLHLIPTGVTHGVNQNE